MKTFTAWHRPLLTALAVALAAPVIAQSAPSDAVAEVRIRKLEAEIRALQRQVFPGGDGKYFAPITQPGRTLAAPTGTPASTPVTDLLVRVDAMESQLARLTAQQEENGNKLAQLEAKVVALAPPAPAVVAATPAPIATETPVPALVDTGVVTATNGAITAGNLAAMSAGASTPKPAVTLSAAPVAKPAIKPAAKPVVAKPAVPSAARLAAVRAIEKPKSDDAGEDEYSYGFRLWEGKFHPEAQQQLKLFLQKYPRHPRRSFARNLVGRSLLDEGKPEEAQRWFLENYKDKQFRDRAADSVLFLAEATKRQKDTARACIALAQFVDEFPREAGARLKSQYDATRAGLKCD